MRLNKYTSLMLVLGLFSSAMLPSAAQAGSSSESAAANNTEAAKKMTMGQVSVNPQTGSLNVSFATPKFGSIDLGLGLSSGLYMAQSGETPFSLPQGTYFKGLPYIHSQNSQKLLFIEGSDYYIDKDYQSAGGDEQKLSSGLRYQTSRMYKFANVDANLIIKGNNNESINYKNTLSYANGLTYYFDRDGLNIAVTDKYYLNDTQDNSKHVYRIKYDNPDYGINSTKILKMINPDGETLNFIYNKYGVLAEIQYPKNASGEKNYVKFDISGNNLLGIAQYLDDKHSIGFNISYSSGLPSSISQNLYKKNTFNVEKSNVLYTVNYDGNKVKELKTDYVFNDGSTKDTQKYYQYSGAAQQSYTFGYDTMLDDALNVNTYMNQYSTRENIGKNTVDHIYNPFHQEIKTITAVDGVLVTEVYNKYNNSSSLHASDDKTLLPATYNMPFESVTVLYNEAGNPTAISKQSTSYNDYGSPLIEANYMPLKYMTGSSLTAGMKKGSKIEIPEYPKGIDPISKVISKYDNKYQQIKEKLTQDCSINSLHTNCSISLDSKDINIFTDDGKNIAKNWTEYKNNKNGETAVGHHTEYTYAGDSNQCPEGGNYFNASLVCSKTLKDDSGKNVAKHYSYQVDKLADSFMRLTTTEKRTYQDTTGLTKKSFVPGVNADTDSYTKTVSIGGVDIEKTMNFQSLGEDDALETTILTSTTEYNISDMPIEQLTAEGLTYKTKYDFLKAEVIKALTPSSDGSNVGDEESLVVEDTLYDPTGNILSSTEQGIDPAGLIIAVTKNINKYSYSRGIPLLMKTTDAFGNYETNKYDNQNRLIEKVQYKVKSKQ